MVFILNIKVNPVLNTEIWKDIPDFPYQASNLGNIRRSPDKKYRPTSGDYHSVALQGNGKY